MYLHSFAIVLRLKVDFACCLADCCD
jgi:hypothetical protein